MAAYLVSSSMPQATSWFLAAGATRSTTTATSITYINPNGTRVVLSGTGFAFSGSGAALAGSVTAASFRDADGATVLATLSEATVALVDLAQALGGGTDPATGLVRDPMAVLFAGADTLTGGTGGDTLAGHNGTDTLSGGGGDDVLEPGRGTDSVSGGIGFDILSYATDYNDPAQSKGITLTLGTAGAGTVTDPWGFTDSFTGIEGVRGTAHGDTMTGDGTDNWFEGLGGSDVIDGMAGYDTVSFRGDAALGGAAGVVVSLAAGMAEDGFGSYDLLRGIEAVEGTEAGDTMLGGNLALAGGRLYRLAGFGGDDILLAGSAGMLAAPGAGDDQVVGGAGFDEVSYADDAPIVSGIAAGIVVDLAAGTLDDPYGDHDTLEGVEAARMTARADRFIGDAGDNVVAGLGGDDRIDGGEGRDEARYDLDAAYGGTAGVVVDLTLGIAVDGFGAIDTLASIEVLRGTARASATIPGIGDILLGSAADESFRGLAGSDYIDGRGGRDMADYSREEEAGGTAAIYANLAAGMAQDGFGATDILLGIEDIAGTNAAAAAGAVFADVIIGSAADNRFLGFAGNDYLDGGTGSDTADYSGDATAGGSMGIYASLADGVAIDGFGSYDALVSIENLIGTDRDQPGLAGLSDILVGSAGANTLDGRAGRDVLDGGEGADTLIGGAGIDTLTGGGGADIFVIDLAALVGGEYDVITDFVPGTDSIRAPLALQGHVALVAGAGQVTLLYDTGSGLYALGIAGATTTAQVEARLSFV